MSDIWSIIKKGKEKLEKKDRVSFDISDDDILMVEASHPSPKQDAKDNTSNKVSSEYELPLWLTRDALYNIRKLKNHSVFELHEELFYLDRWLCPTPFDKYIREVVYEETEKVILEAIAEATVYPFGSFLTNLCLPDSDLDLMVHCNEDSDYLSIIEKALAKSGIATNIVVVRNSRVPLVRFRHVKTGIDVDVSFNQESSLLTSAYVLRQLDRYPFLPSMIRIVKYMLSQRDMNDTYTGGVGSFMVTLLCLSCEQWCIRDGIERGNLGNHLIQFMYFFGLLFNYDKLTIRVQNDGSFISKIDKDWLDPSKVFYLSIENPIDPSLDVGKSSFHIKRFRSFCSHAFFILEYNLSRAASINNSMSDYFLKGLVRSAPRYPSTISGTEFWKEWTKPGAAIPDSEKRRQELIKRHLEAVKKCSNDELRNVYEQDFDKFKGTTPVHRIAQKRTFISKRGEDKKYRRFC